LKILSKTKKLLRNYTQNIDGLEFLADIPADQILECHGHFRAASCIKCGKAMDGKECERIILETDDTPKCNKKKCGGYVKPDIVFFGEGLPQRFHSSLRGDLAKADLLIVMGTSLMVGPVNAIPSMVNCKRVLLNRELVGDFDEDSDQDIFCAGDCDESIITVATLLGWEEDLRSLNKQTKIKVAKHD
jgi:NAD-dependent SIR2 family protein deacetylase